MTLSKIDFFLCEKMQVNVTETDKIKRNKEKQFKFPTIIIGCDFNAGDINWEETLVEPHTTKKFVDEELLRILDFFHLAQYQEEPTRL